MMRLLLLPALCAALPYDPETVEAIRNASMSNELFPCFAKECTKPDMKYELISKSQPGIQWMDHGGYCGSWSIQRAIMAKGAWISQQQVRDHTSPAGGNDDEILASNIDEALKNLKIKGEGFDYKDTPTPQQSAYFSWLKKHLAAGHTVAWMIMLGGEQYPIYNLKIPDGVYGHIEPVVGILSNHPLTDETVYDDDVVVHYTDADQNTYYRAFSTLGGEWSGEGKSCSCQARDYNAYPCISKDYAYGWALQGFLDEQDGLPLSLSIDPSAQEPDTRTGSKPNQITGTVTATGLTSGSKYAIYRWNSVKDAFTYSDDHKISTFTATSDTHVFKDPSTFSSDSATYYRCVTASGDGVVV